jgi:hypoxanthine phosphoribosyltransferase
MKLLYSNEEIMQKIDEIAEQISKDYRRKRPLLVGVLKGCTIFMSHLLVRLQGDYQIDFMTVSSYKHGTDSGELKMIQDIDTPVKGRDVIIVEDIIDSGKTLTFVRNYLETMGAKSVEVVTFVDKTHRRKYKVPKAKYICFEYKEEPFLLGFGFDCKERFRNLPEVYKMEKKDMF